jgi:hypothetical protein
VRRSTRTALVVAIILLFAGGVATAVVRESRDESSTAAPRPTTAPDAARPPAQAEAPTTFAPAPTTTPAPASPSTVPSAAPTTAVAEPSGAASGAGPTSTTPAPPLTAMPNTGGSRLSALGLLLVAVGLLGWRLSGQRRPTG